MPELPEVEFARRLAIRIARGRQIVGVTVTADPIVFERLSPARVRQALLGRRITGAGRKGKHLWLELDRRPWPVFHFGMTGGLHAPARPALRLRSAHQDAPADWPPRFLKLRLDLDDGGGLAFADARRLGRVRLRHDPPAEPPVNQLGFDVLTELPSPAAFRARVASHRTALKALLLDQGFSAGVGNWIADDVLYHAALDPRRSAASLSRTESERLRRALGHVVGTAIRLGGDGDRYPRHWLFHVRWEARPRGGPPPSSVRGERLRFATIGGRTTAWAPSHQR